MDASLSAARSRRAEKKAAEKAPAKTSDSTIRETSRADETPDVVGAITPAAAKAIRRLDWHPSAPAVVLAAAAEDDPVRLWKAWRRHLGQTRPKPLAKALGVKVSPLAWALPAEAAERNTAALVELTARNDRATRKRLTGGAAWNDIVAKWRAEWRDVSSNSAHGLEAIAWCHALPWLVDELSADAWCGLLEHLVGITVDAAAISLAADPLAHQLYAGELALTLAYLFPQIKNTRAMRKPARRALSRGLVDLLNGEGLPTWADLAIARPLLACWTRCAAIGRQMGRGRGEGRGCWDAEAEAQYRWFVMASLRLARRDGSPMLFAAASNGDVDAANRDLLATALGLSADKQVRRVAEIVLPNVAAARPRAKRGEADKKRLPPPSYHCEWSGVSLLRPRWQRGGTRLALAFGAQHVQLEVCCGRDVVVSGQWTAEVTFDGRRLEAVGAWEESCWLSNKWVDYVELQLALAENVVLQRHIVLPRQDDFLLLADSVVGHNWRPPRHDESGGNGEPTAVNASANGDSAAHNGDAAGSPHVVAYRGAIPLAGGMAFVGETETREAVLRGSRDRALVMPLALPEWRSDSRIGSFATTEGALELRQSNRGASLVAPLFFDLRRRRFAGQRTWRQLTVGEDRQIQTPDRAVGYRIHVGDEQWIVYRSLTPRGNRTLLSHNLSTEFLVARFEIAGGEANVDPLVEIE
jgi:hypothetical protein